jgi:hypothetical protein
MKWIVEKLLIAQTINNFQFLWKFEVDSCRSAKIFQKFRNHFKIIGNYMKKFSNENPQTLDAPVQDLVVTATWHPGFVHTHIHMLRGVRHCTLSKAFAFCTHP